MTSSSIRARFAPSPTGYMHVGSVRTALYNYLFAKKNKGTYILRVEDTDQSRKVDGSIENLIGVMGQLSLNSDEGPTKDGVIGQFGPYYQSDRLDIYKKYIDQMLENKKAYRCFCTSERLDEMRLNQTSKGLPTRYDRKCLSISNEDSKKRASGESYVVRMQIPSDEVVIVDDIIRGKIQFKTQEIDDQILLKSDGFPTYHFANIVDDHLMNISHVIRGEEWLLSTAKHILLYQAFDWQPPQFAHLPLLLNADKSKLSKRQGDVAVEDFLQAGYLEEALINFLALLGWHGETDQEIFSLDELVEQFSLERVSKSGAVFDREKLDWMNGQYLKNIISEERYLSVVSEALTHEHSFDSSDLNKIFLALRTKLDKAKDINEHFKIFITPFKSFTYDSDEIKEVMAIESNELLFSVFMDKIDDLEVLNKDTFKATMKAIQKEYKIKGKALFMSTRVALTGQMHGPDLAILAELFSKEELIARFENAKLFLP
ncbi:MAG: glutamate--tRNA ligase [Candidatus Cloacimonadota bacterium]|nr:MAG: glutamate--tRNA ligase [Candidatus Cloacimonadota bacterium]